MLRHITIFLFASTHLILAHHSAEAGRVGKSLQLEFLGRIVSFAADPELRKAAVEAEISSQAAFTSINGLRGEVVVRRLEYLRALLTSVEERVAPVCRTDIDDFRRFVTETGGKLRSSRLRLQIENRVLELLLKRRRACKVDPNSWTEPQRAEVQSLNAQLDALVALSLHQSCLEFAVNLHALCSYDSYLVGQIDTACKYAIRAQSVAKLIKKQTLQISIDRLLIKCMQTGSNLNNEFVHHAAMRLSHFDDDCELAEQVLLSPPDTAAMASEKARRILASVRKGKSLPSDKSFRAALMFELSEVSNRLTISQREKRIAMGKSCEPDDQFFKLRLAADEAITSLRAKDFGRAFEIVCSNLNTHGDLRFVAPVAELAIIGQIASIQLGNVDACETFDRIEQSVVEQVFQEGWQGQCLENRLYPLLSWSNPSGPDEIKANRQFAAQERLAWGIAVGLLCCFGVTLLGWSWNRQQTRQLKNRLDEHSIALRSVQCKTDTLERQGDKSVDLMADSLREPLQAISLASQCVIASEWHDESILRQLQTIERGPRRLDALLHSLSSDADALGIRANDLLDETQKEVDLNSVLKDAVSNAHQLLPGCSFRFALDYVLKGRQRIKTYPRKFARLIKGLCRLAGKASPGGSVLIGAQLERETASTRLVLTFAIAQRNNDASADESHVGAQKEFVADSAKDCCWAEQEMVEAIVRLLGGTISVHRDASGVKCLSLDMEVELVVPRDSATCAAPNEHEPFTRPCDTTQILTCVIDENPLVLESTVATLHAIGCTCSPFSSWEEARLQFDERQFDLIVIEMKTFEDEGFETLADFHNLPLRCRPPVVALAAETDLDAMEHSGSAPFDTVISRPFTLTQLSEVVRSVAKLVD